MLTNIFRLTHSLVISWVIFHIVTGRSVHIFFFAIDLFLLILTAFFQKRLLSRRTRLQFLCTISLGYIIFPNRLRYLGWIYLFNVIQFYKLMKNFRATFWLFKSKADIPKYTAFIFDFIRFGACQYIVLGIVMMVYKFIADQKQQPLPDNYVILYQLIVTATTIGYGDVTPKSQFQMIFFTYTIPIICASFVIYTNNLVDLYTNTFLCEQEETVDPSYLEEQTNTHEKQKYQ